MPDKVYAPIALESRMSDYGYWVVTVSVTPWQRMSVMICQTGITESDARNVALGTVSPLLRRTVAA